MGSTGKGKARGSRPAGGTTTRVQYRDRNGNPLGSPVTFTQTQRGVRSRGANGRSNATGVSNLKTIKKNATTQNKKRRKSR